MSEDVAPSPVVRPAPDPARDARVAARRAKDARRAGRALDALLGWPQNGCPRIGCADFWGGVPHQHDNAE